MFHPTPIILNVYFMVVAVIISLIIGGFLGSYGAVASGGVVQMFLIVIGFDPLVAFLLGYIHTFVIGFWSAQIGWVQMKSSIYGALKIVLPLLPFLYLAAYLVGHISSDMYIIVFTFLVLIFGVIMITKALFFRTNIPIYPARPEYERPGGSFARTLPDTTDSREIMKTFVHDQPEFRSGNWGSVMLMYLICGIALSSQSQFGIGGISIISLYYYMLTDTTGIVAVNQGMTATTISMFLMAPIIFGYPSQRLQLLQDPVFLWVALVIFVVISTFCLIDRYVWKIRDHASPFRTGIVIVLLCVISIIVTLLHFLHIQFFLLQTGLIPQI